MSAGDLIGALEITPDLSSILVDDLIKGSPVTCGPTDTLNQVLKMMYEKQITSILAVENQNRLVGLVHQKSSR